MKNKTAKSKSYQDWKMKFAAALCMLLVSTILMSSTTYAWFVLSTAPEAVGIETQVGANGSLEIALLNTATRADMSTIRSGMGDSMAANNLAANYNWGNLVDLSFWDYGLGKILLLPARLNASGSIGRGYRVDSAMLAVPSYGYDGRVVSTTDNTYSAIYANNEFIFGGVQNYGVRAIGTSEAMTVQESALANAKASILASSRSAKNNAQTVLSVHGNAVFNIMLAHISDAAATYNDTHRDALIAMLKDLEKSVDDIDSALRQGLVGIAASEASDEDMFNAAKDMILQENWGTILHEFYRIGNMPSILENWIRELMQMQNELNAAYNACSAMTGGTYTWVQIRGVLDYVMNTDGVYVDENKFANINRNDLIDKVSKGQEIVMTLMAKSDLVPNGSGIFANIADFTGNYDTSITVSGAHVRITTLSPQNPSYLTGLSYAVNELEAAGGNSLNATFPLTVTYGYAIDLAFRCNAANPDLVLQTTPEQRVYAGSESSSTQGGGSYMEFGSNDATLTPEQKLKLMDAIRVGFLDDQGNLLGIAKLNVSNYSVDGGKISAPLYLYDYELTDDGHGMLLTMGQRRLTDNLITADMEQNVPMALTVMVWLDGDLVDNTMVSAEDSASMFGTLNLQFATTAELVPAADTALLSYTADKTGLTAVLEKFTPEYEGGQSTFTNVSWEAFSTAYYRAQTVYEYEIASAVEVSNAMRNLAKAGLALETVSKDAVRDKIDYLRRYMGEIGETGSLVIKNADGTYSAVGFEEHTQEVHDSWTQVDTINRVDYNNNMYDEGNGLYTPIYSDESWENLAHALYQAEAAVMSNDATDDQLNEVLTAMDSAEKALTRRVFFRPYEYRGAIYYEAICDAANADTYGKWYDSEFKRIVSDLMIVNLDAYAEPINIMELGQSAWVSSDTEYISPDMAFLVAVFPELKNAEVKAVHWNDVDTDLFTELMNQSHYNTLVRMYQRSQTDEVLNYSQSPNFINYRSMAVELINEFDAAIETPAYYAEAVIDAFARVIEEQYHANLPLVEEASTAMTADQRTVLQAAVNAAKAIEGYDEPESIEDVEQKVQVMNLITTTEGAEAFLRNSASATKIQADDVLYYLNDAMEAAGGRRITAYNVLTHKLPEGFGEEDIVYERDYPGIELKLTGESGYTTIGATVLTEDGVVFHVEKDVTVYDRAEGIHFSTNSISTYVGSIFYESGKLYWPYSGYVPETVKSYTWASNNTKVAMVTDEGNGYVTIEAVGVGSTQITLSIETEAGNVYYDYIVFDVLP